MLNITEIDNTIKELENGDTTFASCQKLASLYIIKEHFKTSEIHDLSVENELDDILPQYRRYCAVKRKYQLNEVTENAIINSINNVCNEIAEFIQTLYGSTDMQEERDAIRVMLTRIIATLK